MRFTVRKLLSPSTVIARIALFVALSGTAVAATGLITSAQIRNNTIQGKDVKDGSLTPNDFTGSVSGPQGAAGQQGAPGVKGDQGLQGIQGIQGPKGFEEISRPTAALVTNASSFNSLTVTCPETHPRVIGGGVDTTVNEDFGVLEESYPSGTGGWSVRMHNLGGSQPLTSTVYAICVV
jgi:hypothetical protein